MGQSVTVQKCNFEDIQDSYNRDYFLLINTIDVSNQTCLIKNTLSYKDEEERLNQIIKQQLLSKYKIIIYGKNTNDISVIKKYQQLMSLGFINIFIYSGGMFEWLCLQDIYGEEQFPTTSYEIDILKYKSSPIEKKYLLHDM